MKKYAVYILECSDKTYYVGCTNNVERRLKEHKSGYTLTTSKMTNCIIVYTETYDTFDKARKREVYLKTAAGRRFLREKI